MPDEREPASQGSEADKQRLLVRMGQWLPGQGNVMLETRNLGPCIGIAIYDPATLSGWLAHDPLPQELESPYNQLEDHLRQVLGSRPGSFGGLKAWLSGGSDLLAAAISPQSPELIAANRQFMIEALTDIGIPPESVAANWTPEGHLSANMTLDCATGQCQITLSRLPEPANGDV